MSREAVAIVNPVAGRAHGAKLCARAREELARLFPGLTVLETAAPGHATELARSSADAETVIAVGGDGTVREVATALVGTEAALAVVPVGSGNDFTKTVGIPRDVIAACRVARQGRLKPVDAVRLEIDTGRGVETRYCFNAAGFGFDATVVAEALRLKRLRGLALYLAATLRAVLRYECPEVRITLGGRTWQQRVLLAAAANCRVYGGGMKIAPEALADDGLLDVCVIDAVSRLTILRQLPRFVQGTHTRLREVTMHRAAELALEFREPVAFQLDGDLQPFAGARSFRIAVVPRALRVRAEPVA